MSPVSRAKFSRQNLSMTGWKPSKAAKRVATCEQGDGGDKDESAPSVSPWRSFFLKQRRDRAYPRCLFSPHLHLLLPAAPINDINYRCAAVVSISFLGVIDFVRLTPLSLTGASRFQFCSSSPSLSGGSGHSTTTSIVVIPPTAISSNLHQLPQNYRIRHSAIRLTSIALPIERRRPPQC
ncbi:unnamed protein product [Linum trigynum]|uniref:Uncharacterized protein n=1 Tax=Linum trigynum TaxID=586398 RepID=A0AAV2EV49_9ROSI